LNSRGGRNIRSVLAAVSVQAVAGRTCGAENRLSGRLGLKANCGENE
jgi:hypothetical protein